MQQRFQGSVTLHGVQGVECSNHSVPTNRIKVLAKAALCGFCFLCHIRKIYGSGHVSAL